MSFQRLSFHESQDTERDTELQVPVSSHLNFDTLLGRASSLRPKHISAVHIGLLAFFAVSGGPIGIESIVSAAGPLYALISLIFIPFLWALPQAWFTAELSSLFTENGGAIVWVDCAFGPLAGWMNALNSLMSQIFDLAIYPVLIVEYLETVLKLTPAQKVGLKLAIIVLILVLNIFSLDVVGNASLIFCIVVLSPYAVQFVVNFTDINPSHLIERNLHPIQWGLLINTLLWNFTGWDTLGNYAGEVKEPERNYPRGILFAVILVALSYIIPVAVGIGLTSDWSVWSEGYLITIANEHSGAFIGIWTCVSSVVTSLGAFNVVLSSTARTMHRTSRLGILPGALSTEWIRFNSPVAALALLTLTTAGLAVTLPDFSFLVELDNFFNNLTLISESLAFVYFKYKHPELHRPVSVPGKFVGAVLITLPKLLLLFVTLGVASWTTWVTVFVADCLFAFAYIVANRNYTAEVEKYMDSSLLSPGNDDGLIGESTY